ncbi:PsbP-related protein [Deinococcus arenicola]|uniref:PsbP-related protein n=1 Tax=Deinococcus arenicola TaxID=2994950 RepID=A0ABU4DMZ2_9DEIO|nr:DcrB-related protein [Deinococcus sp. ZS9-10]MDV6373801.1 PsbP-related protein [Deinococcus sp. ZS9-10]
MTTTHSPSVAPRTLMGAATLASVLLGSALFAPALAATFKDTPNGFSVTPPPGWTQRSFEGTAVVYADKEQSGFVPNMNVIVQPLPAGMTLAQYNMVSQKQVKELITDGKIIATRDTTLGGLKAKKTFYTGNQGKFKLYFISTYTVRGGKAYLVTATTKLGMEANLKKVNANFIRNFKFVN